MYIELVAQAFVIALLLAVPVENPVALRMLLTAELNCQSQPTPDFASPGLPRRKLGGWPGLARTIDSLRSGRPALLLDCGNFSYGSLEGNATMGRLGIELLNALGCNAAALGGREFAGGLENLEVLALAANFPVVGDPMLDVALRRRAPLFRPYAILRINDLKVAAVGLVDPLAGKLNPPENLGGFLPEPVFAQARRFVAAALCESADVVVVFGLVDSVEAKIIADGVPGVDVVVAGRCEESSLRCSSNGVVVVSPGHRGRRIGVVDLLVTPGTGRVVQAGFSLVNVNPVDSAGSTVDRLLRAADTLVPSDDRSCYVKLQFVPDISGKLGLAAQVCHALAQAYRADAAVIPWSALGEGLESGLRTMRELVNVVPYGDRLCMVLVDDTGLTRLAVSPLSDSEDLAFPAWGLDYYVAGDTAIWPKLARVLRVRPVSRKVGLYRVVTTHALYAAAGLGCGVRLLPEDLTLSWVKAALGQDTLRPVAVPRLLPAAATLQKLTNERLLNINTANAEELQTLPGIGPKTAERIVEYRKRVGRFRSVDDLLEVRGIGPVRLQRLRPLVTVQ